MAKKKEELVVEDPNISSKDRMQKFRDIINKRVGMKVAFDLSAENPTTVKKWISTGSLLLDRIICKGKIAGIPSNKIVEIAGSESSGKSYIALQLAANALKDNFDVVYFDSENAIDPEFFEKVLSKNGFSIDDILYVQATSIEFVLTTIEDMLTQTSKPILFILDSLANCPTENAIENAFDPLASIAEKARILSLGFQKLTIPLANHDSTLLILNQLRTNITSSMSEKLTEPWTVPGGKAAIFAYSLRLWLTPRKAKDSYILNEKGERIGSEIRCNIKKSRFGTQGREIETKILWGGADVSFQEEEFWLETIKKSPKVQQNGAWVSIEGVGEKLTTKSFIEKVNSDLEFKEKVIQLIDETLLS